MAGGCFRPGDSTCPRSFPLPSSNPEPLSLAPAWRSRVLPGSCLEVWRGGRGCLRLRLAFARSPGRWPRVDHPTPTLPHSSFWEFAQGVTPPSLLFLPPNCICTNQAPLIPTEASPRASSGFSAPPPPCPHPGLPARCRGREVKRWPLAPLPPGLGRFFSFFVKKGRSPAPKVEGASRAHSLGGPRGAGLPQGARGLVSPARTRLWSSGAGRTFQAQGVPSGPASKRQMAGVPVSLPTPGADACAQPGHGEVLKKPEDAAATLLEGLAEGQNQSLLPSPTLADPLQYRGVLPRGGPRRSAWQEDFEERGGVVMAPVWPASPRLPPINFALSFSQLRSLDF